MPLPGLSGVHVIGGVRVNDMTLWPRYRLESVPGLRSLGELEDARDLPAGRSREIPRRALRRGKSFTYQGVIEASTPAGLDAAIDALAAACAPTAEQRVDVTTRLTAGPAAMFYVAQVTALDVPEQHPDPSALRGPTQGHARSFALGVRMSDARFIAVAEKVVQTSGITASGGTPLPWTLPVVIAAPGSASGSVTATNAGTAPADFVVDLLGPSTNPGIRSETSDVELRFALTLAAGQFLRLDFRDRSALLGGTEDVHRLIDRARSTWWDGDAPGLVPGANVLRYVADVLQDPAVATITFNDTYWS